MAVFGLMAHHRDRAAFGPAAAQKRLDARDHGRTADALAVDLALQALPGELAVGQQPDGVAHRLLISGETGRDQPARLGGGTEHIVVGDDGVVEIDADPQT